MNNKNFLPKIKHVELEYVLKREKRNTLILGKNASPAIEQAIIHLFIHGMPMPPIVVKEDAEGIHTAAVNGYIVSTLIGFIDNKIKYERENCFFSDLRFQGHLLESSLTFIVLTPDMSDKKQADIIKAYSMLETTIIS